MSRRTLRPPSIALAFLALLAACSAKVDNTGGGTPSAQTVTVAVDPNAASLVPGQSAQFAAAVTGTADLAVTWTVVETGGGTVDDTGLYTAPSSAGTFHVKATSHADASVSSAATVTVMVPPAGTVAISPKTVTVAAGGTVTFIAAVANLSSSAVTWSLQETSGCGSVSSSGVYTAPSAGATCHVVATSVADTSKKDTATVTVSPPVQVTIASSSGTTTVDACKTLTFTASVTGTSNQAVTWGVVESGGGAVTSAGVYTAPSTSGTYHVRATSQASSAATAQATITVKDHILSIAVTPTPVSLTTGASQKFAATVTTTCGTFTAQ